MHKSQYNILMKEGVNMPYRFKEARLQAGLTTVQLAQKMGVTQAAVSHWDAGKKVPGTEGPLENFV